MVANLRMKVAHLRIFLHVETVLHVSTDGQSVNLVHGYHTIALGTLKYVQLDDGFLGRDDDAELRQTHLEHHVLFEEYLLTNHDERACR